MSNIIYTPFTPPPQQKEEFAPIGYMPSFNIPDIKTSKGTTTTFEPKGYQKEESIQEPVQESIQEPIQKQTTKGKIHFKHPHMDIGEMQEVIDKFADFGLNIRITSATRTNAKTKQGRVSNHALGKALDITPIEGETYEHIWSKLKSTPDLVKYLLNKGIGILDETTPEMLARTGGTGAHLHVGPDTLAVKQLTERAKKWGIFKNGGKIQSFKSGGKSEKEFWNKSNELLKVNQHLNFINRAYTNSPLKYQIDKNNYATHEMGYIEMDGNYYAFPNIVQNKNGGLSKPSDPVKYAIDNNELLNLGNNQDFAEYFTQVGYKQHMNSDVYTEAADRFYNIKARPKQREYKPDASYASRFINNVTDKLEITSPPTYTDGYGREHNTEDGRREGERQNRQKILENLTQSVPVATLKKKKKPTWLDELEVGLNGEQEGTPPESLIIPTRERKWRFKKDSN